MQQRRVAHGGEPGEEPCPAINSGESANRSARRHFAARDSDQMVLGRRQPLLDALVGPKNQRNGRRSGRVSSGRVRHRRQDRRRVRPAGLRATDADPSGGPWRSWPMPTRRSRLVFHATTPSNSAPRVDVLRTDGPPRRTWPRPPCAMPHRRPASWRAPTPTRHRRTRPRWRGRRRTPSRRPALRHAAGPAGRPPAASARHHHGGLHDPAGPPVQPLHRAYRPAVERRHATRVVALSAEKWASSWASSARNSATVRMRRSGSDTHSVRPVTVPSRQPTFSSVTNSVGRGTPRPSSEATCPRPPRRDSTSPNNHRVRLRLEPLPDQRGRRPADDAGGGRDHPKAPDGRGRSSHENGRQRRPLARASEQVQGDRLGGGHRPPPRWPARARAVPAAAQTSDDRNSRTNQARRRLVRLAAMRRNPTKTNPAAPTTADARTTNAYQR